MRRAAGLLLLVLAALPAACGDEAPPMPETDLSIVVEPETYEVVTGRPFALRVTRIWPATHDAAPWDDAALSPLTVRLESTTRREDAHVIEETFSYRAYAFDLEDVKVPTVIFAARPTEGGDPRIVATTPFVLTVTPTLERGAPGEVELFGPLQAEPGPGVPWTVLVGVLLLAGLLLRARTRRRAPAEPAVETSPVTPYERATARLQAVDGDVVEAAEVLRDYAREQWAVPTRVRTTEEVASADAIRALPSEAGAGLCDVLAAADLVKFAAYAHDEASAARLVAEARAFVEVTGRAP